MDNKKSMNYINTYYICFEGGKFHHERVSEEDLYGKLWHVSNITTLNYSFCKLGDQIISLVEKSLPRRG